MSLQAMTWAFSVQGIAPAQKLVLLALTNYANDDSQCWPAQKQLAEDTCMSVRNVVRAMAELESAGLISRQSRRRPDGYKASSIITLLRDKKSPDKPSRDKLSGDKSADLRCQIVQTLSDKVSGLTTLEPPLEPPENPHSLSAIERDFETFWSAWPDKRAKGDARKAYAKARRIADAGTILAGVPFASQTREWRDGYQVHASRWLNGERWCDRPSEVARGPPVSAGIVAAMSRQEGLRRAKERFGGPDEQTSRNDPGRTGGALVALPVRNQVTR